MKDLTFKEAMSLLKNNTFKFYNFYNIDIDPSLLYGNQYYINSNEDVENINQKLKILFLDIESYRQDKEIEFNFDESLHPISAVTIYFNKIYYSFFLNLYDINLDANELEISFKDKLVKNNYITNEENIKIKIFKDELKLLIDLWNKIKELDPTILTGWNSDRFDYPYIYRRLLILTNSENTTKNIMTRFNYLKLNKKNQLVIPEYSIADLLYLYKPRDDGGRNYGKKQISYSLNYVSDAELKLKKFEYKEKNINLDEFYENDPSGYLFYNIIDVVLCVKLEEKLKLIELHNNIRRTMKTTFEKSLIGQSAVFDSFVLNKLNSKIRYGITAQTSKNLNVNLLKGIPNLRTNGKKGVLIVPENINNKDYSEQVNKFDGAYVTKPNADIKSKGITFSLDATSMYPNIMLQYNISFDSYVARVIPGTTLKLLTFLENTLGKTSTVPDDFFISIFDLINKYIETSSTIQKKEKSRKNIYFIIGYLAKTLYESKIQLKDILIPKNDKCQILLSHYLIHLLDLVNLIHVNRESYNDVIYTYIFNESEFANKYSNVYIINNANTSSEHIITLPTNKAIDFFKQYIVTITGTCFLKHDIKPGLFTEMLENFAITRKKYQNLMTTVVKNSPEYQLYNNRQNSAKILMNSNYGVQGLKSFRFSNSHLAQTITTQGKLTIKLAQYITDKYLENKHF